MKVIDHKKWRDCRLTVQSLSARVLLLEVVEGWVANDVGWGGEE